jgi:hypothetical protein
MNYNNTISISLSQYYAFVSDLGTLAPSNDKSTAEVLSDTLVTLAKAHPDAYRDLTLSEKRRLRVGLKDQTFLSVGQSCIDELTNLARVPAKDASLVARALLEDYSILDETKKASLLKAA